MDTLLLARAMREAGADEGKADLMARLISEHLRVGSAAVDLEALEAKVGWRVLRWGFAFFMSFLIALIGAVWAAWDRLFSLLCAG